MRIVHSIRFDFIDCVVLLRRWVCDDTVLRILELVNTSAADAVANKDGEDVSPKIKVLIDGLDATSTEWDIMLPQRQRCVTITS